MIEFRFTLVSDGSSDRALLPILRWLLLQNGVKIGIRGSWADLRMLPRPPKRLSARIATAVRLYPCDVLFVHRDAEAQIPELRKTEIRKAAEEGLADVREQPPAVCVVPVRMSEAWLLFDESAIRKAASNPRGTAPLDLPPFERVEELPDPKAVLHTALRKASGHRGRRLRRFSIESAVHRVANYIQDFSPLRRLPALQALEADVREAAQAMT